MVDCDRASHHVLHRASPKRRVSCHRAKGSLLRAALATVAVVLACPCHLGSAATTQLRPDRIAFWDGIANCETGQRWNWGALRRPGEGSVYEGGVGFAASTWRWWARELGLLKRYPHAYLAPRLVQMRVAEYGLVKYRGYWGCNR